MIKNTYSLIMNSTITCPARAKVIEMAEKLQENDALKIKIIIGKTKMGNKYPLYVDNEIPENLFAFIKQASNKKEELDGTDIAEMAKEKNYEILITGITGKTFNGILNIMVEEGAAKQSSVSEINSEIEAEAKKVIKEGLVSEEDMNKRLEVMRENSVDEYLQLRIIKKYRKYNKPSHKPSCIFQDPYLEDSLAKKQEGIIAEGLRAAASRTAIICEGEKSVGKNVYLETIAWLMNMPMYLITFSRQMSPSSVYGEKTTDNSAAEALADLEPSVLEIAEKADFGRRCFLQSGIKLGYTGEKLDGYVDELMPNEWKNALKEKALFEKRKAQAQSVNIVIDQSELYDWLTDGGLICFNEMNMAEANFLASFANQLLDGTGFLFIPGRGEVPIHPDCVLFATQNADYQGVETQNEATMSRFGCIVFSQPESIKKQLVAATEAAIKKGDSPNAKLDAKYFNECQQFYKQCRDAVNKDIITNACLNIRGFVRALTAVAESNGYAKLKRQIQIQVINTCPTEDRLALSATLEQIITL